MLSPLVVHEANTRDRCVSYQIVGIPKPYMCTPSPPHVTPPCPRNPKWAAPHLRQKQRTTYTNAGTPRELDRVLGNKQHNKRYYTTYTMFAQIRDTTLAGAYRYITYPNGSQRVSPPAPYGLQTLRMSAVFLKSVHVHVAHALASVRNLQQYHHDRCRESLIDSLYVSGRRRMCSSWVFFWYLCSTVWPPALLPPLPPREDPRGAFFPPLLLPP